MSREADTDHHPRQIVRPLGYGEFAPAYSTEELLRGVCHIARVYKPKKELKPSNLLTEGCEQRFNQHFDTISKMLAENKSNVEIGKAIHLSRTTVSSYINMSLELMALSRKRDHLQRRVDGLNKSYAEARKQSDSENFTLIAEMLVAGKSYAEIAAAAGLSRMQLMRRIGSNAVFKQLASTRIERRGRKKDGK